MDNPFYISQPAPLGLTDYGLGATTYAYNTSHVLGQVTFNTPPNATQPGATGVIEPSAQAQHDGELGSVYEFGIQLNTILTNISIPGSNEGIFWTQNVVNWNDTGIHWVSDTFNFSANSGIYLQDGTIYSGCDWTQTQIDVNLYEYGGVFQCVGGTIPISPASYPITLQLYNNASTNAQGRSQIAYGYRLVEAGTGVTLTGVTNTVVFNNTGAPTPANKPNFEVNGYYTTPYGFQYCSEIDIVGGIGGDDAAFRSINGTVNLEYSNASSGGFQNVPSAYNFGGNTGEVSYGIADYWVASTHTLVINQGPAMLYGLWNAKPWLSVGPGDIEVKGSITPSYGFVFMSNTPPVVNAFAPGARDNLSYVPTTDAGTFNTYLPPLGAPWATTYYVQAFADGSAEYNGTVTGTTTTYAITLAAAPGVDRAPLYMYGDTQASQLAFNITGSATPPYDYSFLTLNVNSTFDHINEFGYPEFEVFMAQGVTQPIHVTDVYQGADSSAGNFYIYCHNFGGSTGILTPGPTITGERPYYTSGINIYDGVNDQVNAAFPSQILFSVDGQGSQIVFWQDTDAFVNNSYSGLVSVLFYGGTYDFNGGPGVWLGDSVDSAVDNEIVYEATGVTDLGSSHTTVWNLFVEDALGIYSLSTLDSTYSWINVTDGGEGIETGADYGYPYVFYYDLYGTMGLTVNDLYATDDSLGANITFSDPTTFNTVTVTDEAWGFYLDGDLGFAINYLVVDDAGGIFGWNVTNAVVTDTIFEYAYYGDQAEFVYSTGLTWVDLTVYDVDFGVLDFYDTGTVVTDASVTDAFGGFVSEYGVGFTGTNLNSSDSTFSYELDYGTGATTVNGVSATGLDYIGFNLYETSGFTVTNVLDSDSVTQSPYAAGVETYGVTSGTITGVTASDYGVGARLSGDSTGVTVSTVSSTTDSIGVYVDPSADDAISGVTAVGAIGTYVIDSVDVTITGTTASNFSVGDAIITSDQITDTGATVSGDNATGVYVEDSSYVTVTGVTATAAALNSVFTWVYGIPVSAVVTDGTTVTSVSDVKATNYQSALVDYGSAGLQASNINGTAGQYAVLLVATTGSDFSGIGAYLDWVGLELGGCFVSGVEYIGCDATDNNLVTSSSFVDSSSFGVAILDGTANVLTGNNFIGNNGATGTYSAAHIQASGGAYNNFYTCTDPTCTTGVGNYWADWHTYGPNGYLAPYVLSGTSEDLFPAGPQETFTINFNEAGLSSGTSWSVTLNGVTETSTTSTIAFTVPMGSYAYQVGLLSGWASTPASGSLNLSHATYNVTVTFSSTSTTSLASSSSLNNDFAAALALAAIALVIALVALFWRRKKEPTTNPPAAWTPPAGSTGGAGGSGGSSGWSEGPNNPPPS